MNSSIKQNLFAGRADAPLSVIAPEMIEQLFDHIPDTVFFLKDRWGRYAAVNQSLVERCGMKEKSDLIGRHVRDVFPAHLSERYAAQDETVLKTGRAIVDRLELHWYARRKSGWCLTTKLPVRGENWEVLGIIGISRDLREPGDSSSIPAALAGTLEFLEAEYSGSISPASLAKRAGLSSVRFARLIKKIFRLTPGQLIAQTRLTAASRMLEDREVPIVDVAHACGFSDHSAFTRAFKSATGVTPTQFRKARTEGEPRMDARRRE